MTLPHQRSETPNRRSGGAVLDSHVHFWDPRRISYPWLSEVPPLDCPVTPDKFAAIRARDTSVIFVEAGRSEQHAAAEIEWVRHEAGQHPWIVGAVAHVPLEDPASAEAAIRRYAQDPFVVGVRRNVQDERAGFTRDAGFRAGVWQLGDAGLPFDACVREHQLPELAELAAACPGTTVVLDHLGKPKSAALGRSPWRESLRRLAEHDNVVCKLSGVATELAADTPRPAVISLLHEVLNVFGPERCMFGSDWPMMTLATSYDDWFGLVHDALAAYPLAAADAVLCTTAQRVYGVRAVPSDPDDTHLELRGLA
jgi:predicted TIM-barrel fold metal-dependent hydrolase